MYGLWRLGRPEQKIDETGTVEAALEAVEAECRRRHDLATADGREDAHSVVLEVRDDAGRMVAIMDYTPDVSLPYSSVIAAGVGDP